MQTYNGKGVSWYRRDQRRQKEKDSFHVHPRLSEIPPQHIRSLIVASPSGPRMSAVVKSGPKQRLARRPFSARSGTGHSNGLHSRDGGTIETVMRQADMALYQAKKEEGSSYHFFHRGMDQQLRQRIELEREIGPAIEAGQIIPYYQPLVDLKSSAVIGCEVLARWEHPRRGLLPPSVFIPIAESVATASRWRISCPHGKGNSLPRGGALALKAHWFAWGRRVSHSETRQRLVLCARHDVQSNVD